MLELRDGSSLLMTDTNVDGKNVITKQCTNSSSSFSSSFSSSSNPGFKSPTYTCSVRSLIQLDDSTVATILTGGNNIYLLSLANGEVKGVLTDSCACGLLLKSLSSSSSTSSSSSSSPSSPSSSSTSSSKTSDYLVTGAYNDSMKLWNWKKRLCIETVPLDTPITSLCELGSDDDTSGSVCFFASSDRYGATVTVWRVSMNMNTNMNIHENTFSITAYQRVQLWGTAPHIVNMVYMNVNGNDEFRSSSIVAMAKGDSSLYWYTKQMRRLRTNTSGNGGSSFLTVWCYLFEEQTRVKLSSLVDGQLSFKTTSEANPSSLVKVHDDLIVTSHGLILLGWNGRRECILRCQLAGRLIPNQPVSVAMCPLRDGQLACYFDGAVSYYNLAPDSRSVVVVVQES